MASSPGKIRTVDFFCQFCGEALSAPFEHVGTVLECPGCAVRNEIPDPEAVKPFEESLPEDIVKFYCENCDQRLSSPASLAGRSFDCPNCSSPNTVPGHPRDLSQPEVGTLKFFCSNCGQKLSCDVELAGATIDCPVCSHATAAPKPL